MNAVAALISTWLCLDFFGDARRTGSAGSSLTTTIFAQSFLAFVFAALLYPDTPPVPFAAANLCLSTLLIAVSALGDGGRPNRRHADEVLLATAPLRAWQVTFARVGHAAFHLLLVTIGMALPPGILLGCLVDSAWSVAGYVGCACLCTALATGVLAVLTRASERWLGHNRTALLLGTTKACLLGGGFVLFAMGLQRLRGTPAELPIGAIGTWLLPPWHCARWLADPVGEWPRLLALVGVGALLLLLGIVCARTGPDTATQIGRSGLGRKLLRSLTGDGRRRGIAEFVAIAMWRSPGFRARVLPLLGLPAGMAFLTLRGERDDGFVLTCLLLQLPAIYLPFLIAFLPRADQPGTGWVFDQAPGVTRDLIQDAAWRALVSHILLPVHLFAALLLCLVGRDPLATTAAVVFAFGLGVLAARWQVRALAVVPFTEATEGDASADLGGAFASALLLGGLGTLFGVSLAPMARWPVAAGVLLLAATTLHRRPSPTAAEALPAALAPALAPPSATSFEQAEHVAVKTHGSADTQAKPASLGGELRAILVLYGAVSVLPWLVGMMFAA
jgi:hypothetical protein